MPNDAPIIERLHANAPQLAVISGWTYDMWGDLHPEKGPMEWFAENQKNCSPAGVPSVFVASRQGQPVGTASLVSQDMNARPELTPWLASVYVVPEARGQGIASALVQRVEREARHAGVERLYLYTPDQQRLYQRLGWQAQEHLEYRGEHVTLMTRRP
ncbi:GNAT family N-acetyltransferase [Salinisphaera sp. SPP-AMP-43]|uniref:GNAT family N-acetyltransferase n=1 Tax=Salinisphaera sp. SPP-AMP-43 TaxID=3121288 RepID=UPI003C6E5287